MPAAAVIPAPIVYINSVVVKKLVVGFRSAEVKVRLNGVARHRPPLFWVTAPGPSRAPVCRSQSFIMTNSECSKQA